MACSKSQKILIRLGSSFETNEFNKTRGYYSQRVLTGLEGKAAKVFCKIKMLTLSWKPFRSKGLFCCCWVVLEFKSRASSMLGKDSTTEPYSQPSFWLIGWLINSDKVSLSRADWLWTCNYFWFGLHRYCNYLRLWIYATRAGSKSCLYVEVNPTSFPKGNCYFCLFSDTGNWA